MLIKKIEFEGSQGVSLAARLDMPAAQPRDFAIFAHCFTCSKDIHAEDCEDCETKEGRIDRIDKTIELLGELDDAQPTRLMEIADRCPVHRTLQSEIIIHSTNLKESHDEQIEE
ncbi:MAG: hypothetical protein IT422_20255 [Pirellulaceae bacterium]|nr:hypothetical protein [Pirellulaceae bacterium]